MNEIKEKLKDFKVFSKNTKEIPLTRLVIGVYGVCLGIIFGFSETNKNTNLSGYAIFLFIIAFLSFISLIIYFIKRKKHIKKSYNDYLQEQIIIENQYICKVNNSKNKEKEYFYLILKNYQNQEEYDALIKKIEKLKNTKGFKEEFENVVNNKSDYVKNDSIGKAIQGVLETKIKRNDMKLISSNKTVYTMYINEKNKKVGYGVKYY